MANRGAVPTGYGEEFVISSSTFKAAQRYVQNGVLPGQKAGQKRKREGKGDSSVVYGENAYKGPWAKFKEKTPEEEGSGSEIEVTDYSDEEEEEEAQRKKPAPLASEYAPEGIEESTEFHGESPYDYQGRTYMHVPRDLDIDLVGDASELKNYVPKKVIHTWKELSGASITQMRFFPSSGHLMLAANAAGKIKLFDMYHSRSLLRSFNGHNKSANDISFSNDGSSFVSSSYDRQMKIWDTETGTCKAKFTTGKTPHVVRFYPLDNNQFVAGMADKKIVQFDIRTPGEVVQEYDHHLGPVNTITFCDEGRRFVTTSDDKSLRAWEYNIPVPIKFIAEPHMYAMNRSCSHPKKEFILFQSTDNSILVYSSSDKFRQNRKKSFRGHNNSGYAVDVAMSPDGEFVMSGDTAGWVCWWSWRTCKMLHKERASKEGVPVVSCAWHPRETSKVVTGDVNGLVRYWD